VPEPLFELRRLEIELPRQPEKTEVVAVPADRQDLGALRAEVRVHRRAAAAIATDLKSGSSGGHGDRFKSSTFQGSKVRGSLKQEPGTWNPGTFGTL
jgi:hypothetical protein